MARLNEQNDSDEEFPEVSMILQHYRSSTKTHDEKSRKEQGDESLKQAQDDDGRKKSMPSYISNQIPGDYKNPLDKNKSRGQRPLKLAHVNSLLLPIFSTENRGDNPTLGLQGRENVRTRVAESRENVSASSPTLDEISDSEDHLSDFIVDGSSSGIEDVPIRASGTSIQQYRKYTKLKAQKPYPASERTAIDLISPDKLTSGTRSKRHDIKHGILPSDFRVPDIYFENNPNTYLRFSPPRAEINSRDRHITPPPSPSKDKLQSPSKKNRIPPSPHRPSIDAFWSQEVVNEWNDQHSPKKTPNRGRSRKLFSIDEDDVSDVSPSGTPRKSPLKSPLKKDKKETQRRKLFDGKKHATAASFLNELDGKITNGQVAALASSAGGIHIVWSKKLNSTAGRANWKREALRSKSPEGGTISTTYRHHASIELAEKVIDDEDRLYNVIAHEYCHLANFMISGIKNNPHGKEFKEWARKVTTAFSHLGIQVTTKHSYAIAYKYIWTCTSPTCGVEFKRHSKSIDPARHSCGKCKHPLVQIQPAPRAVRTPGKDGVGTGRYQEYVRTHFARVKDENPAGSLGLWMSLLGKGFREERDAKEREKETDVVAASSPDEAFDQVARKLDFLSLGN